MAMSERYVKLFKNGRNQVVRIPREFELPGEDAIVRKEGQRLTYARRYAPVYDGGDRRGGRPRRAGSHGRPANRKGPNQERW
jgi:hypothetical protein